jgi:hypothetical protein
MGKVVMRPAISRADGWGGPGVIAADGPCGLDSTPLGPLLIIRLSAS